jgi:hypothetical protein
MRGVQVPPGEHQIEFHFTAPHTALFLSLLALALGFGLLLFLGFSREPEENQSPEAKVPGSKSSVPHPKSEVRG